MRRSAIALGTGLGLALSGARLSSAAPEPSSRTPSELPADASIDFASAPPEGRVHDDAAADLSQPPPARPRPHGLVLESTLGLLGFGGRFRHVAPPAYWLHTQLGFEVLRWLMVYGEAELALTDTSEAQSPSRSMAFPLWSFGGGARATVHVTERVAFYGQAEIEAMSAVVPHNALRVLGYKNAESLQPAYGARLAVEWYQIDRHLALVLTAGGRYASGLARSVGPSDVPLLWDGGAGLRYAF